MSIFEIDVKKNKPDHLSQIYFGMGCFWGAERMFWQLNGVFSTSVGYTGGKTSDPTYKEVCSGTTEHAEVVLVVYDSEIIRLDSLLNTFWEGHNPTQFNRQGNDIGHHYRSIIFYKNEEEKRIVNLVIDNLKDVFDNEIVTEIAPEKKFYTAEKYHHDYYLRNSFQPYCAMIITPKINKVRKKYLDLYLQ